MPHPKPNVVLLSTDSLRADHLSCYGYRHQTSPQIDAIAAEGALFERVITAAIPTHPSYTTLFSGQHPITHGVVAHGGKSKLSIQTPVLAQLFVQSGYTTCCVDLLPRQRFWFGRGFEYVIDPSVRRNFLLSVTWEELNHRIIPWIRQHSQEPFFLFVHYWEPHYPYVPPEKYRGLFYEGSDPTDPANRSLEPFWNHPVGAIARDTWLRTSDGHITDANYVAAMYDQEIRHLDDGIAELVAAIDDAGLGGNTLVAFTGDHGESMTEHNIYFDHYGLYDCVLNIPLILRWPGVVKPGLRFSPMLELTDLAPTLLEAAGLAVPACMDGRSFWRQATGESTHGGRDRIFSLESTWQAKWSMRTDTHKLILARQPDFIGNPMRELYDLQNDPGETVNIAEQEPKLASDLETELEGWICDKLKATGRAQDPIVEHGISLSPG